MVPQSRNAIGQAMLSDVQFLTHSEAWPAGQIPNCHPITKGWYYLNRLYRSWPEILNGVETP
jgi:hypothetical protein